MSTARVVYIDGSNVAHSGHVERDGPSPNQARLATIRAVRDVMRGWGASPIILADVTLPRQIDDRLALRELIHAEDVSLVEDRPLADLELLERAEHNRAPVLSNDGFDDHLKHYPWAWACVVDCMVKKGVVLLEAPKLACLLDMPEPREGVLGGYRWARLPCTYRHRGGVERAKAWLQSPRVLPAAPPDDPVELVFPEKASIGWLYRRGAAGSFDQYVWKLARGVVVSQRGEWLGLEVRGRGVRSHRGLERLPEDSISEVQWHDSALVDDARLARLIRLRRLEDLRLNGQPVSNAGMRFVARLSNLRHLEMSPTLANWDGQVARRSPERISDDGMAWLVPLAMVLLSARCRRRRRTSIRASCAKPSIPLWDMHHRATCMGMMTWT